MPQYIIYAIIIIAAGLRFYHLDTPAMWWDEILVPMTAMHSWEYLADFSLGPEMHPPYFGALVKLMLLISPSEFFLRSISAVAGTATIGLIYLTGRSLAGNGCGLIAASLLMANPYMLWLSRQVRPYALLLLSLSFVLYVSTTNSRVQWLKLAIAGGIQLLLHYVSIFLVFAQSFALSLNILLGRTWRSDRTRLLGYLAIVSGFALAVFPFFIMLLHNRHSSFIKTNQSYTEVFSTLTGKVIQLSSFFNIETPFHLELVLIAFGAAVLFRKNVSGLMINLVAIIPLFILFIFKDSYVYYWHISFLLPSFALMFSVGLCLIIRIAKIQTALSLLIILVAIFSVITHGDRQFYSTDSHNTFAIGTFAKLSRPAAQEILSLPVIPNQPRLMYTDSIGFTNSIGWYFDIFCASNPLTNQRILKKDITRNIWYISNGVQENNSIAPTSFSSSYSSNNLVQRTFQVDYKPFFQISRSSMHIPWPIIPELFYSTVTELQNLFIVNHMGPAVVPTKHETYGMFTITAQNTMQSGHTVFLDVDRSNTGKGNQLQFFASFDGKPHNHIYSETGPKDGKHVTVRFETPDNYSEMELLVTMKTADRTSDYEGGNQQTIKIQKIDFFFEESGFLFDILKHPTIIPKTIFSGIEGIEHDDKGSWRWMLGPDAAFAFDIPEALNGLLTLRLSNPIHDQRIIIYINDIEVGRRENIVASMWLEEPTCIQIPVVLRKGTNLIVLKMDKWNWKEPTTTFNKSDSRTLASALMELSFTARE